MSLLSKLTLMVQVFVIIVSQFIYGQGSQTSHLNVKAQTVDSSVTVEQGFTSLIYVNNELYNKSTVDITVKWRIDSIQSDIPNVEGGICTEVCYPTSLITNTEPIRANDSIPFKAYFIAIGGFQQSGTATLYASVYDTLDSAGTFLTVSFTLHLTVDTATVSSTMPASETQCLISRRNHLHNNCPYVITIAIYDGTGRLVDKADMGPMEHITLQMDRLFYVVPLTKDFRRPAE